MSVIDHGPCPKCRAPNHYLEPVGSPAPTWLLRCEGCGTETAFPEEVVVETSFAWLEALVALRLLPAADVERVRAMARENLDDLRGGRRPRWMRMR